MAPPATSQGTRVEPESGEGEGGAAAAWPQWPHQPGDKFHFAVPVITNLHCVSDHHYRHHYRRPVRGTLIKWTSLS